MSMVSARPGTVNMDGFYCHRDPQSPIGDRNHYGITTDSTDGLEFTLAVPITILYNHRLSTCNNNICLLPMGTSIRFRVTALLNV